MALFPVAIGALLLVIFLRLWFFQVVKSQELVDRAQVSNRTSVSSLAPRGLIYDRNNILVAGLQPRIVITATPGIVHKNPWVLDKVAEMVGAESKKLKSKMDHDGFRKFVPIPIFVGASVDTAARIAEAGDELPGIGVETQPMRYYPDPISMAHVLGYVWTPSARDLERLKAANIDAEPYVGKVGIEKIYERDLVGKPGGEQLEVDAKRRPVRVVGRDAPTPGQQLILTLDSKLQAMGQELLKGKKGAIVALDPRTGEVLCMVSSPTYDASLFLNGIGTADYDKLNTDPDKPLIQRAVYSSYSPGSTFKIVTTIAAMEQGVFNPNETIFCDGGYRIGNRFIACLGHHGSISFNTALEKSCNTYFMTLAHRVGVDALRKASAEVGLGETSGIDASQEQPGLVPTAAYIQKIKGHWYEGMTLNFGIGQGELATTPLQMANVISLVANNGTSYKPHLVRATRDPSTGTVTEKKLEVYHHVEGTAEFWATLKGALVDVIDHGTGGNARIDGVQWGGKTGSAEKHGQKKTNSWFVGYAPAENPTITIAVVLEDMGHGGDIAAPIAKQIVQHYLTASAKALRMSSSNGSIDAASVSSPPAR